MGRIQTCADRIQRQETKPNPAVPSTSKCLPQRHLLTYQFQEKPGSDSVMTLVLVYSSKPMTPYSLPKPLLPKPPKGASKGMTLEQFFHTTPAWSCCATLSHRSTSSVITAFPSP